MSRLSVFVVSLAIGLCSVHTAHAQIYRWDNGQVIPGTEGIALGPAVVVNGWNTQVKNLRFGDFQGKNLRGADFTDNWLDDARFAGANLTESTFFEWGLSGAGIPWVRVSSLTNADLTGAKLLSADISGSTLTGADLTGANLTGAKITSATLTNANFANANLAAANLYGSDLVGANLTNANLTSAKLGSSVLRNAVLTGARVTGANFSDATSLGFTQAQLQSTASYQNKDLRGIALGGNDMTSWDLQGQDLTQAYLAHSVLTHVNLTGAMVSGASFARWLVGQNWIGTGITPSQLESTASYRSGNLQGIDLSGSQLDRFNLSNQNLIGATFDQTSLIATNLSNSNLSSVKMSGATLDLADLRYTNLKSAVIGAMSSFNSANLEGANLESAKINHSQFLGANLKNATLALTNLTGSSFQSANMTDADFTGANLGGAGFSSANLTRASFQTASLDGGLFLSANLTGANLTNTFARAFFSDAILYGTDFRGAVGWLGGGRINDAIQPNGTLQRLAVSNQQRYQIRDYDGVPDPAPAPWLTPHAPTPITVQQYVSMVGGSTLELLIDSDPWNSIIKFQPGIPVDLGGTLSLTFLDNVGIASQAGRTIKVFDWTGVNSQGTFTVAPQPGTAWDTSKLYTTGEVTLLGISSDLNGDKDVDSDDLTAFLANWTGAEYPAADKTWRDGDSDADGDVDSADMLVFLSQWTGAAVATASRVASVPEPGGLLLLGLAFGGLFSDLRRRERGR